MNYKNNYRSGYRTLFYCRIIFLWYFFFAFHFKKSHTMMEDDRPLCWLVTCCVVICLSVLCCIYCCCCCITVCWDCCCCCCCCNCCDCCRLMVDQAYNPIKFEFTISRTFSTITLLDLTLRDLDFLFNLIRASRFVFSSPFCLIFNFFRFF